MKFSGLRSCLRPKAALIFALALPLPLAGCPGFAESVVGTVAKVDPALRQACGAAMQLAPYAPSISPWIVAGCGTEAALAAIALDPSSLAWVNTQLIPKAQAVANAVNGAKLPMRL